MHAAQNDRATTVPQGFPCGRRSPKGRLRWYLVRVPEGRERAVCEKVRKLVPPEVLDDAFVVSKERWFKQGGVWSLRKVQMFREYFFVATRDVAALDRELAKLSFPARIAGAGNRAWAPLDPKAQEWLESAMDSERTIRNSVAVIEGGELKVQSGPLVGQEPRVAKVDRHRRRCTVDATGDGAFVQQMPLDVPFKG